MFVLMSRTWVDDSFVRLLESFVDYDDSESFVDSEESPIMQLLFS